MAEEKRFEKIYSQGAMNIMEIWVECFGKERQNLKKADSYEIEGILNKIGGWKKYDSNTTGKTKVPLYGVQKTFVRMDEKPEETR